ncbi:MAG TPA: ROK family protein [Candidatus Dormibacteraeota bacterium]|nr:ROK family protein [Candidatus Dormibacteraeota bacterium]
MFGAIDIGGTKTLIATFDLNGKLVNSIKFMTPNNYQEFKKKLNNSYQDLGSPDMKLACVACPGRLNRNKGIAIAFGNLNWINIPIRDDLEIIFNCPIIIENDAKLAGLYEANELGNKYRKVLYLTISTGIGGGLIIAGKINKDFEDMEPGQMLLEHEKKLQRWEHFASGKALALRYHQQAGEITDPKIWYDIARNIAVGLIDLIALYTPNVIIIGGGVGAHLDKFKDQLVEDLKIYKNPLIEIPPVLKAKNAENAVIYGCYLNAKEDYAKSNY